MTERDQFTKQQRDPGTEATGQRGNDDRRAPVDPTEKRVPNSPEPDHLNGGGRGYPPPP